MSEKGKVNLKPLNKKVAKGDDELEALLRGQKRSRDDEPELFQKLLNTNEKKVDAEEMERKKKKRRKEKERLKVPNEISHTQRIPQIFFCLLF